MNVQLVLGKLLEVYTINKVYPDMLILGKALGNGYPITCILGKESIINHQRKLL